MTFFKNAMGLAIALLLTFSVSIAASLQSNISVYQFDANWTTSKGEDFKLSELTGNKQVIAMIYTDCPHVCPVIVDTMKQVQERLADTKQDNTGFVLISFTPEKDTPEVLAKYAQQYELDDDWTLLQGSELDTRIFANLIGMKYKVQIDGVVDHANTLSVFDEAGALIKTLRGVHSEIDNIVDTLQDH